MILSNYDRLFNQIPHAESRISDLFAESQNPTG